jgi:hypothetical protein
MRIGAVYKAHQDLIARSLIDLNIKDSLADRKTFTGNCLGRWSTCHKFNIECSLL